MMPRWTALALGAVLAATLALPAAAQWKWRDAAGHTQYSDTPPPPNVAEKDILQRPSVAAPVVRAAAPAPASGASDASTAAPKPDAELEAKRKQVADKAAADKKADEAKIAALKAENCAQARQQMRTLDSGMRMATVNEKGERVFLDDKTRAQEADRARAAIGTDCK